MDQFLQENVLIISLSVFITVLFIMALWEVLGPKRPRRVKKSKRWFNNFALIFLNTLILRFLMPISLIALALFSQERGWGVFNYTDWPLALEVVLAFVFFDFAIYLQHVLVHAVPLLWRLHQVHHADMDLDVTSGARFHTLEMILSMLIKYSLVVMIGPPILAVVIFEVVLNAAAMFNHSNVKMPELVDKILRWIIVTPDMHRIHHSTKVVETNSNFGFNLPWWDRIFGTYIANPQLGQEKMNIGLNYVSDEEEASTLWGMLKMPFTQNQSDDYTMLRGRDT
ncbi:MAG: sterol desaturase family protein [Bdellovibrionales bacterium]|nr:sterol desaturase family protein [Bdellovibrionales bacterium]